MYWSRTNSLVDIALFLLLSSGWALGGYFLVRAAFYLRRSERIVAGLGVGFLLFIGISNLLAHLIQISAAFWFASLFILLAGVIGAWRANIRPWMEKRDLRAVPLLVGLVAITVLFTFILRSESIFDEYVHLPLISIMAAGDIPLISTSIPIFILPIIMVCRYFPPVWSAWQVFSPGLPGI